MSSKAVSSRYAVTCPTCQAPPNRPCRARTSWRVTDTHAGRIRSEALLDAALAVTEGRRPCHCGQPVTYGYDGDPTHHRGMCADCDAVRCDAYPMDCPMRRKAGR